MEDRFVWAKRKRGKKERRGDLTGSYRLPFFIDSPKRGAKRFRLPEGRRAGSLLLRVLKQLCLGIIFLLNNMRPHAPRPLRPKCMGAPGWPRMCLLLAGTVISGRCMLICIWPPPIEKIIDASRGLLFAGILVRLISLSKTGFFFGNPRTKDCCGVGQTFAVVWGNFVLGLVCDVGGGWVGLWRWMWQVKVRGERVGGLLGGSGREWGVGCFGVVLWGMMAAALLGFFFSGVCLPAIDYGMKSLEIVFAASA